MDKTVFKRKSAPAIRKTGITIKQEIIKGKKYYVARRGGKIQTRKKVSGSGLSLQTAKEIYLRNNNFSRKTAIKKTVLINVIENVVNYTNNSVPRRYISKKRPSQVGASVEINGTIIHARSNRVGTKLAQTIPEAIEDAENNLYERVSGLFLGVTDADEGKRYLKEKKIKIKYSTIYYEKK